MGEKTKSIKIVALTPEKYIPSRRFRVVQYKSFLEQRSIYIDEYYAKSFSLSQKIKNLWSPVRKPITAAIVMSRVLSRVPGIIKSHDADLVWIQRPLLPGHRTLESFTKKPRVLDVDDAIWLDQPFGMWSVPQIAKHMDAVIAGNEYIADWFSQYSQRIYIVPTAVNTDIFTYSQSKEVKENEFIIGWTGTSTNFKYLYQMEKVLYRFLKDYPRTKFMVVADKAPDFQFISSQSLLYVPWSPEIEAPILQQMDVGIMPLEDDEWTRGKCSFKMLQYMASRKPVIVSPVGMNQEVLRKGNFGFGVTSEDEWYDSLKELFLNKNLRDELGKQGRKVVEENYSTKVVAAKLSEIFRDIIK